MGRILVTGLEDGSSGTIKSYLTTRWPELFLAHRRQIGSRKYKLLCHVGPAVHKVMIGGEKNLRKHKNGT